MGSSIEQLAAQYESRYGLRVTSRDRLTAVCREYMRRSEDSILEGIAAAAAIDGLFLADRIDMGAVTPQMERAFGLAFPGQDIEQRLSELNGLAPGSPEVLGVASNWKGKLFEVWTEDRLNEGYEVGGITLGAGQSAVLAEDLNQPGFDLQILNADGSADLALQLKATDSLGYVKGALERYPEFDVVSTDEVAGLTLSDRIFPSGVTNDELDNMIAAPTEAIMDSPIENLAEAFLPFLPVIVILSMEGVPLIMRRRTFEQAVRGTAERSLKSGAAIGAGALAVAAGAGFFSLPVAFFARLGVDRVFVYRRLASRMRAQRERLALLADSPPS